jgi:hypothetical protein
MTDTPAHNPVAASVLFLRRRGSAGDAAQQPGWHEQLLATARQAITGWDPGRRVVLQSPDGLAFVGDVAPSVALHAAAAAAREGGDELGIALHHGPVQVIQEGDGVRVAGEALETASALAAFGGAKTVVISQSFRDAFAGSSPHAATDLRSAGEMVDDQLRKHPIFMFDADAARGRSTRRKVLLAGGLVLLLGAGGVVRIVRKRREAARRPAVIHLDVKPSGSVYIDGQLRGTTPPMHDVQVPPGPHSIEVRSGRFPPLRLDVRLEPGEQMQLKHEFAAPPAPAPARRVRPKEAEQPDLIEQLKERWKKLW